MTNRDSQTTIEENFDQNEVGLQPPFVKNRILANYIKTFTLLFGRDEPNSIWRMLRTDNYGVLRTTNSQQNDLRPLKHIFTVPNGATPLKVISADTLRKEYMIINDIDSTTTRRCAIHIQFGLNNTFQDILLPTGWGFKDSRWSGDVFVLSTSQTPDIMVMEFF